MYYKEHHVIFVSLMTKNSTIEDFHSMRSRTRFLILFQVTWWRPSDYGRKRRKGYEWHKRLCWVALKIEKFKISSSLQHLRHYQSHHQLSTVSASCSWYYIIITQGPSHPHICSESFRLHALLCKYTVWLYSHEKNEILGIRKIWKNTNYY